MFGLRCRGEESLGILIGWEIEVMMAGAMDLIIRAQIETIRSLTFGEQRAW